MNDTCIASNLDKDGFVEKQKRPYKMAEATLCPSWRLPENGHHINDRSDGAARLPTHKDFKTINNLLVQRLSPQIASMP